MSEPRLMKLRPSQLNIEPLAQRGLERKWVDQIAAQFNPDDLGVLEVALRDGKFWVIDGQHRQAALVQMGLDDPVPCVVIETESVAQDAEKFLAKNAKNRRPNPIDTFLVAVTAGDPEAVAIQEVLDKFGLVAAWGVGKNDISAISALRTIYRKGGTARLVGVLTLTETVWGRVREGREGNILKAFALILSKVNTELDFETFAAKLAKAYTPGRLLGTARAQAAATGRKLSDQVAEVMVTAYNKGRTNRITLS